MKMREIKNIINRDFDECGIDNVLDQYGLSTEALREGATAEAFREEWDGMIDAQRRVMQALNALEAVAEDFKAHEDNFNALCARQDALEAEDAKQRDEEAAPTIIIVLGGR